MMEQENAQKFNRFCKFLQWNQANRSSFWSTCAWPAEAAIATHEAPVRSQRLGFAPAFSKADTNGSAPQAQAMCKAVWPAKHLPNKRWNMKYGEIWWNIVKCWRFEQGTITAITSNIWDWFETASLFYILLHQHSETQMILRYSDK